MLLVIRACCDDLHARNVLRGGRGDEGLTRHIIFVYSTVQYSTVEQSIVVRQITVMYCT